MAELTLRLVFSLAIVLGLLILCARVAGKRFKGRHDAMVQIVHRQPIGRHATVSVVNVNGRILVLGTTDQQVRLLTELDPEDAEAAEDAAEWAAEEFAAEAVEELVEAEVAAAYDEQHVEDGHEPDRGGPLEAGIGNDRLLTLLPGGDPTLPVELHAAFVAGAPTALPEAPAGGRHAALPPGRHAAQHVDQHVDLPAEVAAEAHVEARVETPTEIYTGSHAAVRPAPRTEPQPEVDDDERLATPESVAKALRALAALDALQGRPTRTRPATVEVPAAMLLAEEPAQGFAPTYAESLLEELADSADGVDTTPRSRRRTAAEPSAGAARRATARRGSRARVSAPVTDNGRLAGSVLSTRTWRQAWGAVSGKAS